MIEPAKILKIDAISTHLIACQEAELHQKRSQEEKHCKVIWRALSLAKKWKVHSRSTNHIEEYLNPPSNIPSEDSCIILCLNIFLIFFSFCTSCRVLNEVQKWPSHLNTVHGKSAQRSCHARQRLHFKQRLDPRGSL